MFDDCMECVHFLGGAGVEKTGGYVYYYMLGDIQDILGVLF